MPEIKLDDPFQDVFQWTSTKHTDTYPYIDPLKSHLSGKAVLVTGASRGVGKAVAISYAKAGVSNIAILARSDLSTVAKEVNDAAQQAKRPEPKIITIKCDITSVDDCANALKQVEEGFGRLDILINNAGYLEKWAMIHESDPDDWWRTFEVNVKGVYLMTRAFIPLLLSGGDKTIVTTTSIGALVITPTASAYQITKQAELRLNDFLTKEYGDQGLLAYGVHPGGVKTDLANGMPDWMMELLTDEPELPGDTFVWLTKERREWLADRYVSCAWDMKEFLGGRKEIEERDLLKMRLRV
ncbi:hypothetical protein OHC33_010095 [Knufia fluminis]|uniref:Uncharacterized protein n=1 Tax=Knufia fluminis TaxID=191047 RepID=A0AAN8I2K2_9EURO|nr:hypothetical protein OHC33_010095 [Knufia fluminis]